jgi:hypothetical protein
MSVILGAAGAITRFALEPWASVGDILMVAGALGAIASILWMAAATRDSVTETTSGEGAG